jgi:arabinose-5-phosphate isomerase
MSLNPKTIDAEEMAEKALFIMEEFRIQMLFVVDTQSANPKQPIGLIHLQDLLKSKVR